MKEQPQPQRQRQQPKAKPNTNNIKPDIAPAPIPEVSKNILENQENSDTDPEVVVIEDIDSDARVANADAAAEAEKAKKTATEKPGTTPEDVVESGDIGNELKTNVSDEETFARRALDNKLNDEDLTRLSDDISQAEKILEGAKTGAITADAAAFHVMV